MNLREIDRLVAEKVMGCEEAPSIWFDDYDKSKKYYCINDTPDKEISIIEYVDRGWAQYLFHPSEIMEDAWQAVEEVGYEQVQIKDMSKLGKRVYIEKTDSNAVIAYAETVPVALCLAALKAVGVEVEVNEQ
ncbi:hypothetical protein P9204_04605 [Geobacillus stearothermophilus]|nr:hypothetical protein [Geobacillus stearothermophilus]